jgi:mRNA interferase MazF
MKRFDIYWVQLDPTLGREIQKTRPCVIISPDEMNRHLQTVIVAPVSSTIKELPFRVKTKIKQRKGSILLDQMRAVDRSRLIEKMGSLTAAKGNEVLTLLQEMFSE